MKVVAVVVTLLLAILIWAQVGGSEKKPSDVRNGRSPAGFNPPTYELTAATELKEGIRQYAETVYTLYQRTSSGKRQLWRILSRDNYAHHWISPNGMVWVVTKGMAGPGGAASLWARDAIGSLRGSWGGHMMSRSAPNPKDRITVGLDVDPSATKAVSLHNGSEQLKFVDKRGNEFRTTIVHTDRDEFTVSRIFARGESKTDLLTDLLNKPSSPPMVEWVAPNRAPIAVWTFFNENPNRYLIQFYDQNGVNTDSNQKVSREYQSPRKPSYVDRTPTGKLVWVEFGELGGPALAKLDVLDYTGKLLTSMDLLKYGKFTSTAEAQRSIIYRDIQAHTGRGFMPLDSDDRTYQPPVELLQLSDRTGRKYQIDLRPLESGGQAQMVASYNIGKSETKEPIYPGADLSQSQNLNSADGKFSARVKTYQQDKRTQSQITLIAHVIDPVEGGKSVEMYSISVPYKLASVRVSNSGRVYAISYPIQTPATAKMCQLQAWDPSGRNLAIDLMQSFKWFSSLDEAKAKLSLDKATFEFEGIRSERMVDGVPIPNYPTEAVAFNLGNRVERVYIGYMNDQIPVMFYYRPPGKSSIRK